MKTNVKNQNEKMNANYFASATTLEAAKKLYKKLVVSLHPDKNNGNDEEYKRMQTEYDEFCKRLEREAVAARAYVLADGEADEVTNAAATIKEEYKVFRCTLEANLSVLRAQYNECEKTKRAYEYLSKVTATPLEDLFNVDFVRKLYKVYTFDTKNGGLYTCIAERRKKSDKTNFAKLEERAANKLDEQIIIASTLNKKTKEYYLPVYNFTPASILKYLLKIDTYAYTLARYNAKKREDARKAKKAAKKAKKADAQAT